MIVIKPSGPSYVSVTPGNALAIFEGAQYLVGEQTGDMFGNDELGYAVMADAVNAADQEAMQFFKGLLDDAHDAASLYRELEREVVRIPLTEAVTIFMINRSFREYNNEEATGPGELVHFRTPDPAA